VALSKNQALRHRGVLKWHKSVQGMHVLKQVVARVPSTEIASDVLLNPLHVDWRVITWDRPTPFNFDPRLFT
jgi:hypothetical protein